MPIRTRTASNVWLVKKGDPLTPPAGLSSQKVHDWLGATTKPIAVATAPETAAVAAAR